MERIRIVDTHTGGEPTRVVVSSPVVLDAPDMHGRREQFQSACDHYRRAIVCEPRGSDVMVGALLTPPVNPGSVAGVVFFNNVGTLGMCGHGLIGVARALMFLETIDAGKHGMDTPVGTVQFSVDAAGKVQLQNVPSYRLTADLRLELPSGKIVHGDVAWGGNWFFICEDHGLDVQLSNLSELLRLSCEIRRELTRQEITGKDASEIDHVELIGPPTSTKHADAKNFVLCPGGAYDRSPCGTGTSAKVACLAARGALREGEIYRQESIVGSLFLASYQRLDAEQVLPTIEGQAFVNGEGELLLDPLDPFSMGIPS